MAIFNLQVEGNDLSRGELVAASEMELSLELHLESWLEKSPWSLAEEPFLWIGKQPSAYVEETTIFPDLLGLDGEGNLVIVELKKGRAPRDVVAQLLEYTAWANALTEEQIIGLGSSYYLNHPEYGSKELTEIFTTEFETEEMPALNQRLRLFIAAEDIPPSIIRVCRFLRMSHGLDINCIEFSAYRTESGEIIVSTEAKVGREDLVGPKQSTSRWSGDKPVKEVVWEAVEKLTQGDKNRIFSPKEVSSVIHEEYPDFKLSNVNPELSADCVNHPSRHHYPGGKDRYWWITRGQYRLYDPAKDRLAVP